jgi:hypothetical protein
VNATLLNRYCNLLATACQKRQQTSNLNFELETNLRQGPAKSKPQQNKFHVNHMPQTNEGMK